MAPPCCTPSCWLRDDADAIVRDGRRLDHAEGASKPLRSRPEPQPRGAKSPRQPADRSGGSRRALHRRARAREDARRAAVGSPAEARPRDARHSRMGGAALARLGDQGAHAHASRRISRAVRGERARERHPRALGARRRRAQPHRPRHSRRSRRQVADQEQVDADRGVRLPALHGVGRDRGDRDRSRRAHPAARPRRPEPHRGAGRAQAQDRRGARCSPGRSAPTPATATCTTWRKRSARRPAR